MTREAWLQVLNDGLSGHKKIEDFKAASSQMFRVSAACSFVLSQGFCLEVPDDAVTEVLLRPFVPPETLLSERLRSEPPQRRLQKHTFCLNNRELKPGRGYTPPPTFHLFILPSCPSPLLFISSPSWATPSSCLTAPVVVLVLREAASPPPSLSEHKIWHQISEQTSTVPTSAEPHLSDVWTF